MLSDQKKILCCNLASRRIELLQTMTGPNPLLWDIKAYLDTYVEFYPQFNQGKVKESLVILDDTVGALGNVIAGGGMAKTFSELCQRWHNFLLPSDDE